MRLLQPAGRSLIGFFAGVLATVPMTIWMLTANRALPKSAPDRLPPEEITHRLTQKTDTEKFLTPTQKKKASLFNHLFYGGVIAVPLAWLMPKSEKSSASKAGLGYGLLVWVSNYLGLLPALDLYPPATREPARMNGIMIIAHVIWGSSLGLFLSLLMHKKQSRLVSPH